MYTTSMNLEFQMALHTYNAAYHKQKRGTCKNLGETFYPSNPQLLGLSAFFACKARNNHLVAHVLVQQKRLRHKSPLPHKAA